MQLLLPENPSDDILMLAQAIKMSVAPRYNVVLRQGVESDDDGLTPVEIPINEPALIIEISERSLSLAR